MRRKYLSLGTGELVAAAVFAVVAISVVMPRLEVPQDSAALWSALAPLLIILVQAGAYWLLARNWVELAPMPTSLAALYRAFRVLDAGVLVAGLVGVLVWLPITVGVALAIVVVWIFGVVEYVNYFVVRLSYPVRRLPFVVGQWRTPRLVQDLNAARFRPPGSRRQRVEPSMACPAQRRPTRRGPASMRAHGCRDRGATRAGVLDDRGNEPHLVRPSREFPTRRGGSCGGRNCRACTPFERSVGPYVAFPPVDVVGLDVGDVLTARGAAAVALAEGEALRPGEEPGGPPEVERDAVAAETAGMSSASAAMRRAVAAEIGWSRPSMRACPMPLTSVSRSRRTTTVVFASGVSVCAQPSVWRASAASASAWICGIVRAVV